MDTLDGCNGTVFLHYSLLLSVLPHDAPDGGVELGYCRAREHAISECVNLVLLFASNRDFIHEGCDGVSVPVVATCKYLRQNATFRFITLD